MTKNKTTKYGLWALACLGSAFLLGMLAVGVITFLNVTVPYQPFAVRSVKISKTVACTGEPITVHIDRKFTQDFSSLSIKESWVDENGRPVKTESGTLPSDILRASSKYQSKPSPLLGKAPADPGTYHVVIHTESRGQRWFGGLKAKGTSTLRSDNEVVVVDCHKKKGDIER